MEERWQESRAQLTSCRRGTRCQILSATTHSLVGAVSILSARIAGHWPRFGTEQPSNDHASGVVQCPDGRFLDGRLEVPWRGGTPRGWDGMGNLKSGRHSMKGVHSSILTTSWYCTLRISHFVVSTHTTHWIPSSKLDHLISCIALLCMYW
jgi:hypothetical protein